MCNHQFVSLNPAAGLEACAKCGEARTVSVETVPGLAIHQEIDLAHQSLDEAGIPREIGGQPASVPVRISYLAGMLESVKRYGAQSIRYEHHRRGR